jgi:tyrosine-protein kinase Etk/Wzc
MESTSTTNNEVLKLLYRHRLFIFIFSVTVVICCGVFSAPFFLTPLYQSEVIIYPPATNSNRMLIERDARFGSDKEIDEQIQLLRSSVVRDSVIVKFKLYQHYEIDATQSDKKYKLYKVYDDHVKIDRTRFNSISISVLDKDPMRAAAMADFIVATGDALRSSIIKAKLTEAVQSLEKSLFELSFSTDKIAEELNKSYGKPVASGTIFNKRNSMEQLKEQLDLKELIQEARRNQRTANLELLYFYESKLQQMSTIQLSYDQALVGLSNQVPSSFVISPADIPDKKTFPVRWIIVLAGAIGGFFMACLLVIMNSRFKDFLSSVKS